MAFSNVRGQDQAIAEINIIPLCDVLLVLLIIFMVTAPVLSHPIGVDLPQPCSDCRQDRPPPPPVELRIDAAGQVFWNSAPLDWREMTARMDATAAEAADAQPVLRVSASDDAEYQVVARVLAEARNAGLAKVGLTSR